MKDYLKEEVFYLENRLYIANVTFMFSLFLLTPQLLS